MSEEITLSLTNQAINGNLVSPPIQKTFIIDQANRGVVEATQVITLAEVTLNIGNLTTVGFLYMENIDLTNFILFGFATGVYGGRLNAGEPAEFRVNPGTTVYLAADTANCELYYRWLEN